MTKQKLDAVSEQLPDAAERLNTVRLADTEQTIVQLQIAKRTLLENA